MQEEDFKRFLEHEICVYAEQLVRTGNWSAQDSLERSRKEFEHYLPEGIHSKDQHLFSIVDESENKIGGLWVEVKEHKAFIFDFVIDETYRGKGFGEQALIAMDGMLRAMNVESVALHVFGDNLAAQELYKKMGFEITGIHMRKILQ